MIWELKINVADALIGFIVVVSLEWRKTATELKAQDA
jgi:hypothetical protein